LSGGEIPIQVASGLGTNSIEFRPFGTELDIVPLIHGQGELTLEVRAEVSEVAPDLTNDSGVPGFRVRRVNTGVRMRSGYTLALAGDYKERSEAEKKGIPHLMDSPFFGPAFRRTQDQGSETELVFLITPRFISEVDPCLVPRMGPGQLTDEPSAHEFYHNGYQEVPKCYDNCPTNDRFDDCASNQYPAYQQQLLNGMHQNSGEIQRPQNGQSKEPGADNNQINGGFSWPQGTSK
jgi:pilus assembly protein CpaC